jgi:hypothetical protein
MIAIEACTDHPVQASPGAASLIKMELFRYCPPVHEQRALGDPGFDFRLVCMQTGFGQDDR